MDKPSVEIDHDALAELTERLRLIGAKKVAVVSVMGAYRTGKSFILDLMLRYLRHGASCLAAGESPNTGPAPPERGTNEEYPLPDWLTASGDHLEGVDDHDGFRFKGGMDACTEGIWVWSEPFLKKIDGEPVGLLLFDTQGAWDGNMTKEQSATIFGLTAVLSSKQIYNISVQIQEDKVENLTYFMRFAQTAIQKAALEVPADTLQKEMVDKPFQSLDFLVRDFKHFRDEDNMDQCKALMQKHMAQHTEKTRSKDTAEVLKGMFQHLGCFCLPHPGFAIEKETWKGGYKDISPDFIRMADVYINDVFTNNLDVKKILGSELTPLTFGLVVKDFVEAFADAAPVAMTFTQAITNSTVLLAKEQAMKSYTAKMEKAFDQHRGGMEDSAFQEMCKSATDQVEGEYKKVTIFGNTTVRDDTWTEIKDNLNALKKRFEEDNARRLEKALAVFANISILGLSFFTLDRISDYTCDWWSQTCVELSKVLLLCWLLILGYVGFNVYMLLSKRGKLATASAAGELWKEMVRLVGVYYELVTSVKWKELPDLMKKLAAGKVDEVVAAKGKAADKKQK